MSKISELIAAEEKYQAETIRLIASENYISSKVRAALGSGLSNKYSEGYPGERYYEGNEYIDQIERYARELASELFEYKYANVQPLSGTPANLAIYMALLEPGDTILSMKLDQGGHLSHGHRLSASGVFYEAVNYGVDEDGWIDYEQVLASAKEHQPKLIVCGASAYPREIDFVKFREIADEVGAYLLADVSHIAGLIAGGVHPSPHGQAHVMMTTTHKTLRGPRGALIMCDDEGLSKQIDQAVFPGYQGGPHNATIAALAVALEEALSPSFTKYAAAVVDNASVLARELEDRGYTLVSGGTDNHLMLLDMRPQGVGGRDYAVALAKAGLIANCNSIPNDESPPKNPSGLRIGTAAVTTRGMEDEEMIKIAEWMNRVLKDINNEEELFNIRQDVKQLCEEFPLG